MKGHQSAGHILVLDDVDATLKEIEEQGGSVVQGKTHFRAIHTAYFKDSEGNVMGLVQGMM